MQSRCSNHCELTCGIAVFAEQLFLRERQKIEVIKFGASLQLLKVEVGGGKSTAGSEPAAPERLKSIKTPSPNS
jgi:hypothetical protein